MDKFEFSFNGDTMQASLVRIFGRHALEVTNAGNGSFIDVFMLYRYRSGNIGTVFALLAEASGELQKTLVMNRLTGCPTEGLERKGEMLMSMVLAASKQGDAELNVTTSRL